MKAREWKRERTAPGRIRRAVAIVAPDCITGKFRIFMGAHARSPSREIMQHSPFQSTLARLSRKLLHCERSSIKLSPSLSISPSLSREWEREAIFTLLPAYVRVCLPRARFFLSLPPRLFFLPPPSLLSTSITFFSLSARSPCPRSFSPSAKFTVSPQRACVLSLFPWFSHSLTRFFSRASAIALTVLFLWLAGREQAPLDARAFKIGRVRCILLLSSPLHLPFVPVSASHFCMFFLFHLVFCETVCVCVCVLRAETFAVCAPYCSARLLARFALVFPLCYVSILSTRTGARERLEWRWMGGEREKETTLPGARERVDLISAGTFADRNSCGNGAL